MTDEEKISVADDREGGWAEGVPTTAFVTDLNPRSYATAERYIFGSQAAVTTVRGLRRARAPRLAALRSSTGPRIHLVDDAQPTQRVRIVKSFPYRPR